MKNMKEALLELKTIKDEDFKEVKRDSKTRAFNSITNIS